MHDFARDWAELFSLASLVSVLTLTGLEIVLGIDNVIFIAIVAGRLPKALQPRARAIGLSLALIFRIGLLISITWILGLQKPLLTLGSYGATGRDLILMGGGLFLLIKTVGEIADRIRGKDEGHSPKGNKNTLQSVILQIVFIDIVFSFDSILTAVSMVNNVLIMIGAVILAMFMMLGFSGPVSDFINRHPTIKMLALTFLLMIAMILMLDALHVEVAHIKMYVYGAMGFAFLVELLNMWERSSRQKRRDKSEH
jgi:predicted tellurium resistance membrane protein TerC